MKKEEIKQITANFIGNRLIPFLYSIGFPSNKPEIKKDKENGSYQILLQGDFDLEKLEMKLNVPFFLTKGNIRFYAEKTKNCVFVTYNQYEKIGEKPSNNFTEEEREQLRQFHARLDQLLESTLNELRNEFENELINQSLSSQNQVKINDVKDLIPKKISKNYQEITTLKDVQNWKTKIILGNNCRTVEDEKGNRVKGPGIGDWDTAGYTMINLDNGNIVPISRSDEHHQGFDLIDHLISKRQISNGDYYPIFFANNYVYADNVNDIRRNLKAFTIWLNLGGEDTTVTGCNGLEFCVKMSDYVRFKGKIKNSSQVKKELLPIGKRFIGFLDQIALGLQKEREGKRVKESAVFEAAFCALKEMNDSFHGDIGKTAQRGLISIAKAQVNNDLKQLEQIIFAHNGIKNIVHIELKSELEKEKSWNRDLKNVFGDIKFAVAELDRISGMT